MNRRNFFGALLAASAGFAILPGAGRIWKAVKPCGIMSLSSGGLARWKTIPEIMDEMNPANAAGLRLWLEACRMNLKEPFDAWPNLMKTKTWPD